MDRPESRDTECDAPVLPPAREALARLRMLATVSQAFLEALASEARVYSTYRGQTIIEEGEEAKEVFFLIRGKLSVQIESIAPNIEVGINRIESGEIFGEMGLLGETSRSATIVTREPSVLIAIPIAHVEKVCAEMPAEGLLFHKAIAGVLAERVRDMNHKVLNMMRARYR